MKKLYPLFHIVFSFSLLTASIDTLAQEDKPIKVVGAGIPKANMYFIAEVHSIEESDHFNFAMIRYLNSKHGVRNIVIERGRAYAYLLNRYINENDSTLFRYYGKDIIVNYYPQVRQLNATLPAYQKVRYFGMDFERMEFVAVVKMILERSAETRESKLYQYVCSLPDSLCHSVYRTHEQIAARRTVYREAQRIFDNEKEILKKEVKTDYDELEAIMENPADESKFSRRDRGMYRNIKRQLNGQPFLCIVGGHHTEYRRGEVYQSLVKKLMHHDKKAAKDMVIFDEVHRGRFATVNIWAHEGAPVTYDSLPGGPRYFVKEQAAMDIAYRMYSSTDSFTLVHKSVFRPAVTKDNHGINSYYVFFQNVLVPKVGSL